jgi:hypothetical protein
MMNYRVPDQSVIKRILSELDIKLEDTASAKAADKITEIVRALNYDSDFNERNLDKKQVNAQIRSLNDQLGKIDHILNIQDKHLQQTVNTLLARTLSHDLTNALFGQHMSSAIQYSEVSFRDMESRETQESEYGRHKVLEESFRQDRRLLSMEMGSEVLKAHLGNLRRPLEAHLELQRLSRGGRPANNHRKYLILNAAKIYQELTNKSPKRTLKGPFHRFCSTLMGEINMDMTGLEEAIPRVLKNIPK